jgi:hypothetical protein
MTLRHTILFLTAAIVLGVVSLIVWKHRHWFGAVWLLCLTIRVSGQWYIAEPSYNGPSIVFADGTGAQLAPYLTGYQLTWLSDMMGSLGTLHFTCISPDENKVYIGQPYPGTNRAVSVCFYSDGSTTTGTNTMIGAGFEFWTTDGSSNLAYQVKAHLADLMWTPETAASPFFGYYSAPEQYFELASNVTNCWFQNSLQAEQSIDTNTT